MTVPSTHSRAPQTLRPVGVVETAQLIEAWRAMLRLTRTVNLPELRRVDYEEGYESLFAFSNIGPEVFVTIQRDRFISTSLAMHGEFDFSTFQRAAGLLGGRLGGLIDVGANLGTIAIPAAARGLAERVVAIEPDPLNFRTLMANLYLNDLAGRITAVNCAAGSRDGDTLEFQSSPDNIGDHRVKHSSAPGAFGEDSWPTFSVPATTVDSILAERAPSLVAPDTLLWVDVQGWEAPVLAGADRLLAAGASVVIEFWPYMLNRNGMMDELGAIVRRWFPRMRIVSDPETPDFETTEAGFAAVLARLDAGNALSACDLLLTRA